MRFQKTDGRVDVLNHRRVTQSHAPRRRVIFAVRWIAMIKVRRRGDKSLACSEIREFDKGFNAGLTLNNDDRRRWRGTLRPAQVHSHFRVSDVYVFPGRAHDNLQRVRMRAAPREFLILESSISQNLLQSLDDFRPL